MTGLVVFAAASFWWHDYCLGETASNQGRGPEAGDFRSENAPAAVIRQVREAQRKGVILSI